MAQEQTQTRTVSVIGGGPAGLMAAEALTAHGLRVDLYDAMPSVGRKFLLAGRGGLNLTHSEAQEFFLSRYGDRRAAIQPWLDEFGPDALREWAHNLGIRTFVGTSGRVFPSEMKAAPLLRAWLHRLRSGGVSFHVRHRWSGWDEKGDLVFSTPTGERTIQADAVVFALGGGSWPRLGSDGRWMPLFEQHGVPTEPLKPSNCGFEADWSDHFGSRFAGHPVKAVNLCVKGNGDTICRQGEFAITTHGVEGSLIYAVSALLRREIEQHGSAILHLDLSPGKSVQRLTDDLSRPRGSRSLTEHLRRRAGIEGVKAGLLRELVDPDTFSEPRRLAEAIKHLPLRLNAARPLEEAISSAGGIRFEALDERLMVRSMPGVFCTGEMLDWEAPTGGYLLTACFAGGRAAGLGVLEWLKQGEEAGIARG